MIIAARSLPELLVTIGWRGLCEDVLCLAAQISLGCVSAGGPCEIGGKLWADQLLFCLSDRFELEPYSDIEDHGQINIDFLLVMW